MNKPFLFVLFFLLVGTLVLAQVDNSLDPAVPEDIPVENLDSAVPIQETTSDLGIPISDQEYLTYNSCLTSCSSCPTRCKDSSLQQYAENKNDISFCDKLSSEDLKIVCKDHINMALAIASLDKSKCDILKDEEIKSSCLFIIVNQQAVAAGNVDACNTLTANLKETCVNGVYFQLAQKNNDASFCNKLSKEQKTECLSSIQNSVQSSETPVAAKPAAASKLNLMLILLIVGSIIVLAGISLVVYLLIKRKNKVEEAPLLFSQQQQPSQLAQGMVQNPQVQSPNNPNIDLNRLQEALKKVEK